MNMKKNILEALLTVTIFTVLLLIYNIGYKGYIWDAIDTRDYAVYASAVFLSAIIGKLIKKKHYKS